MNEQAPTAVERQRGKGERGAVLMIVAICLPVLILLTAFAIDLGRQRSTRRTMQARADVIALDMARLLDGRTEDQLLADPSTQAALVASATRNGIAPAKLTYEFGTWTDSGAGDEGNFNGVIGTVVPDAVEVTAKDEIDYFFQPGTGKAERSAVASNDVLAAFAMGTKLATVNTTQAQLLNGVLGDALNTNFALSAATYQGLVGSTVNVQDLSSEMGFGTPEELADADVNARDFFLASAQVLERDGQTGAANVFNAIALGTDEDATLDMGQVLQFSAGGGNTPAAEAGIDAFNLLTGSAYAINGDSAIGIPGIALSIPNFGATTLSLTVIERARTYWGREGDSFSTQQADLTAAQSIGTPVALAGLLRVTGNVSLRQRVAGATGTIQDIDCGAPSLSIGVAPQPVATTADLDLTITLLGIPIAEVKTGLSATPNGTSAGGVFDYTSEFMPPVGTGTMVEAPTSPLGLQNLLTVKTTDVTLLGVLPLGVTLGSLVSSLNTTLLNPLFSTLDNAITGPVSTALGLSIGSADIGAVQMFCNAVKLVH